MADSLTTVILAEILDVLAVAGIDRQTKLVKHQTVWMKT